MMLISSFRFSATDNIIKWNLSQIVSPSYVVGGDKQGADRQGLPVSVETVI